ncbi:MAG: nitrile hydratase accessory protein [Gammaproteobacteria bacterium]
MSTDPTPRLPLHPEAGQEPVFAEPWQAQAFALTLKLHQQGCFSWSEWADCLAAEITAAQQQGDPDLGDTYYLHWLKALERLVTEKGLLSQAELLGRKQAWDEAARHTPHGQPIVLPEHASNEHP